MARAGDWLKAKAPGLHRFLTRRDGKWPLLREALYVVVAITVLLGTMYGLTGQSIQCCPLSMGYPVVVVTTGSMMHCENYPSGESRYGATCQPTHWGRLGSIDPGDLVFVRHVGQVSDVTTFAEGQAGYEQCRADPSGCCSQSLVACHYGRPGDVIVYRPNNSTVDTPIIHRALFWVQVNPDMTYSVPAYGLDHVANLDAPALAATTGCAGEWLTRVFANSAAIYGTAGSGFVTRGDNNNGADQCPGSQVHEPARLQYVLGKARGELPWIGLVNLAFGDFTSHCAGSDGCNYDHAGGDSKAMFFVTIAVLVAAPWAIEVALRAQARRRARRDGKQD